MASEILEDGLEKLASSIELLSANPANAAEAKEMTRAKTEINFFTV